MMKSFVLAEEVPNIKLDFSPDSKIEQQLDRIIPILEQAKATNNPELYYIASTKGYKIKKTGDIGNIKKINDFLSASSIEYALQCYELTKDKKYLNKAYKWSKIAIDDRSTQIYSIHAAIVLAGFKLNLKNMQKAYMHYRAIDAEGAEEYYPKYQEAYKQTQQMIFNRSQERRQRWAYALYSLSNGLNSFSSGMQNAYRNQSHTSCYTIGNTLYCNSY